MGKQTRRSRTAAIEAALYGAADETPAEPAVKKLAKKPAKKKA